MTSFVDVDEHVEEPLGVGRRYCSYEENAPSDVDVTMKDLVIAECWILAAPQVVPIGTARRLSSSAFAYPSGISLTARSRSSEDFLQSRLVGHDGSVGCGTPTLGRWEPIEPIRHEHWLRWSWFRSGQVVG